MNELKIEQSKARTTFHWQRFVFFLSLVFFGVALSYAAGVVVYTRPGVVSVSLFCKSPEYDFGRITKADLPEHKFVLINRGKKPISISRVMSSCGSCVRVVDYTRSPIPPGREGFVTLKLLVDLLGEGKVSKDVLVVPDNPVSPVLFLTLNAEITADNEKKAE